MRRTISALGIVLVVLGLAGLASAWWVKGHEAIAEAGCLGLPDDVPAFFRAGSKALAHYSGDPDRWKNREAHHLNAAEACNHYLDMEDLNGNPLPDDRWKAVKLLIDLKQKPEQTGMLPYALMENFDRLSCAFYDYRQDPKDEAVRAKCLVYAGVLSHFTGDCVMPLHTTRSYDGRKGTDGTFAQKGIHARIDSFPEKFGITTAEMARDLKANKLADVWATVIQTTQDSHKQVDKCYELDKLGAFDKPTDESRKFIVDRCRVGAQLTMDLWYTAWLKSAKMPKPY